MKYIILLLVLFSFALSDEISMMPFRDSGCTNPLGEGNTHETEECIGPSKTGIFSLYYCSEGVATIGIYSDSNCEGDSVYFESFDTDICVNNFGTYYIYRCI